MTVSFLDARGGMMANTRNYRSAVNLETLVNRNNRHSDLWKEEPGAKIIYSNTSKDQ